MMLLRAGNLELTFRFPLAKRDNELTKFRTNKIHCTRDSLMRRSGHHGNMPIDILLVIFSIGQFVGTCGPYPYEIICILLQFVSSGRKAKKNLMWLVGHKTLHANSHIFCILDFVARSLPNLISIHFLSFHFIL